MEENELTINFTAFWEITKQGKWFIALSVLLFAIITAYVVFNKPNEFTSTASVMPELESTGAGGSLSKFAGLASLAGVDLSSMSSSDAVRPDLYPSVINNTSFFLYLLEQEVKTSENSNQMFLDFYVRTYELELDTVANSKGLISSLKKSLGIAPKVIIQNDSSSDFIYLPKYKGEIIEELKEKIVANMDKKTGIISVSVELPDPVTSAYVAKISMDYLTNFVTNYRTEKARQDLNFLAEQLASVKGKYYSTQSKKAQYSDKFQSATIRLQAADIQRERIEADYRVSSTFYTELMKQYESAKMDLQKQTPVFKTLEQPVIPYEKSGPRRVITILAVAIFGGGLGIFVLMFRGKNYQKIFQSNA